MKAEDNELLTRVEGDAPMGQMLRRYWHPVLRSAKLVADGAPARVRLLGQQFVAFRVTGGRIGFVDEGCPHRGASLSLARNEADGLRCIFHGWKMDVRGRVVEVPTMPAGRREAFAANVQTREYAVREAAGIVWVCLQRPSEAPPFPEFEFMGLDPGQLDFRIGIMQCNWVQGMESVLDSAHLGFLHQGQLKRNFEDDVTAAGFLSNYGAAGESTSPDLQLLERPYGFREGALRPLADGRVYVKVREFVAPYYAFLPGNPETLNRRILCCSVPVDDTTCAQWFIYYNLDKPPSPQELLDRWAFASSDPDNIHADPGSADDAWRQDREAMRQGHFSGFPKRHIFDEDFIVQESMGPIVDRTRENLNPSDEIIVYTRRKLLEAARAHARGEHAWGLDPRRPIDYAHIRSGAIFIGGDDDWRQIDFFKEQGPRAQ